MSPQDHGSTLLRFASISYPSMQLLSSELLRSCVGPTLLNSGSGSAIADLGIATNDLCTGFGNLVQNMAYAIVEPTAASGPAVPTYEGLYPAVLRDAEHAR